MAGGVTVIGCRPQQQLYGDDAAIQEANTRHVVSINDLTNNEIEQIFELAQSYLKELSDKSLPYRISRSTNLAAKFILATLFYEPSTRTRLSFESAMLRLGGENITSADPNTSSAAKGESIADLSGSSQTTQT